MSPLAAQDRGVDLALKQLAKADWLYLVPLAVLLALICIITGAARRIAAFYLLTGVGVFGSLVWAFTTDPDRLTGLIAGSGFRVVVGVIFVSIAAAVQLSGELAPDPGLDTASAAGPPERILEPAASTPD